QIMVFHPTEEEFSDFGKYIQYMESVGAHKAGIAKVVPPASWIPRRSGYDDIDVMIPGPLKQIIKGGQGKYQCSNIKQDSMHVKDFKAMANSKKYRPPDCDGDMESIERKYWKNVTFNPAIYGADVSDSLYDKDQELWNPAKLKTILDHVEEDYNTTIEGVTSTYLYFGMWKSTFAWHTEDMDLYSINVLHFGAPKFWYSIPTEHGRKLERLAASYFPDDANTCANFLRHKSTLISPTALRLNNIPYNKIQQGPRDIIISFPFAYHAGFNTGFNCAESTNFASLRWIEYGKRAIQCDCRPHMVRFSMKCFVRRYQPDKWELFQNNLD
ncbi:hypothetical protein HELRODRAFT_132346, partial [Helobdella robusta]|uniref:JmjC domain-containing protein n=1 Tax=Helobdella robusta TaxID=6412 RepID=T1EHY0_HELRO